MKRNKKGLSLLAVITLLAVLLAGCGISSPPSVSHTGPELPEITITEQDARAALETIHEQYYFQLFLITAAQVDAYRGDNPIDPYYWAWLAPMYSGEEIFAAPFVSESDLAEMSEDARWILYYAYSIADMQAGADALWGPDRVDVASWTFADSSFVFVSSQGYLLMGGGYGGPYDKPYYKITDVLATDNHATVTLQYFSYDFLANIAVDEATGRRYENLTPSSDTLPEDFDQAAAVLGLDTEQLGTLCFSFYKTPDGVFLRGVSRPEA